MEENATRHALAMNVCLMDMNEPLSGVGKNGVGRLLGEHVDRRDDEEARNAREHGGIDDAKSLRVVNAKVPIDDRRWIARGSHLVRARRVVTPRVVADVRLEIATRADVRSGPDFARRLPE